MLNSASAPHAWGTAVPALFFLQLIAITRCSLVTYKFQLSPVILSSEAFATYQSANKEDIWIPVICPLLSATVIFLKPHELHL